MAKPNIALLQDAVGAHNDAARAYKRAQRDLADALRFSRLSESKLREILAEYGIELVVESVDA